MEQSKKSPYETWPAGCLVYSAFQFATVAFRSGHCHTIARTSLP
jgi:hypothetical protein